MSQIVCRMNCANVLCMKLSKKWFLLHFKQAKIDELRLSLRCGKPCMVTLKSNSCKKLTQFYNF